MFRGSPRDADNHSMEHIRTSGSIERDEHGMIASWLLKLAIGFLLVAVLIFDGGSILVNYFTLDSTADEIAVQLTTRVQPGTLTEQMLQPQAAELATAAGARLVDLRIEGDVVFVKLRRRADTLVVGRIDPIADWARATTEGQAGTG